jgi:hypothetical protein
MMTALLRLMDAAHTEPIRHTQKFITLHSNQSLSMATLEVPAESPGQAKPSDALPALAGITLPQRRPTERILS